MSFTLKAVFIERKSKLGTFNGTTVQVLKIPIEFRVLRKVIYAIKLHYSLAVVKILNIDGSGNGDERGNHVREHKIGQTTLQVNVVAGELAGISFIVRFKNSVKRCYIFTYVKLIIGT
jgi:hypothetical protein